MNDLLITQILNDEDMSELIDIFNRQARLDSKGGMIFEPEGEP